MGKLSKFIPFQSCFLLFLSLLYMHHTCINELFYPSEMTSWAMQLFIGDILRLSEASLVCVFCLWYNKNNIFGMLPGHRDLGWPVFKLYLTWSPYIPYRYTRACHENNLPCLCGEGCLKLFHRSVFKQDTTAIIVLCKKIR